MEHVVTMLCGIYVGVSMANIYWGTQIGRLEGKIRLYELELNKMFQFDSDDDDSDEEEENSDRSDDEESI